MGGNEVRDFNGFITQDGEMISIQDTERVSAIFLKTADVDSAVGCLWQLAIDCIEAGYFIPACKYIEKILPLVDDPCRQSGMLSQNGPVTGAGERLWGGRRGVRAGIRSAAGTERDVVLPQQQPRLLPDPDRALCGGGAVLPGCDPDGTEAAECPQEPGDCAAGPRPDWRSREELSSAPRNCAPRIRAP